MVVDGGNGGGQGSGESVLGNGAGSGHVNADVWGEVSESCPSKAKAVAADGLVEFEAGTVGPCAGTGSAATSATAVSMVTAMAVVAAAEHEAGEEQHAAAGARDIFAGGCAEAGVGNSEPISGRKRCHKTMISQDAGSV